MRTLPIAALLALAAVPAAAQPPADQAAPEAQAEAGDEAPAASPLPLPSGRQIQEMAPGVDRMADALLNTDVGPLLDVADPLGRHAGHGQPGRTLGAVASRHDPYFAQRLHASIYRNADKLGRMSNALAAAAPALAQQAHQLRQSLHQVMRAYRDAYHGTAPTAAPGHAPAPATPGGIPDDD